MSVRLGEHGLASSWLVSLQADMYTGRADRQWDRMIHELFKAIFLLKMTNLTIIIESDNENCNL